MNTYMKNKNQMNNPADLLEARQLLAFKTIVEAGGFTKAARQLHLTQSALSHQIKTLETQLGTQVFARIGEREALTQAGEVLLRYATPVLRQLQAARRTCTTGKSPGYGRLRISSATYSCYRILPLCLRGNFTRHTRTWSCWWQPNTPREPSKAILDGELDFWGSSPAIEHRRVVDRKVMPG